MLKTEHLACSFSIYRKVLWGRGETRCLALFFPYSLLMGDIDRKCLSMLTWNNW